MVRTWFTTTIATVFWTSAVFAQGASVDGQQAVQPNLSTNGPPGTYDQTRTRRTTYANGVEVDTQQSFHKSQAYNSGNGALSATTVIKSSGPTTTVTAPFQNPQEEPPK